MCLVRVSARGWGGLQAIAGLHRARRGRRAVGDHHSEPTADRVVVADRGAARHADRRAAQGFDVTVVRGPTEGDPPGWNLSLGRHGHWAGDRLRLLRRAHDPRKPLAERWLLASGHRASARRGSRPDRAGRGGHRPGVAVRGDRAPGRGSSWRRMDPGARARATRVVAARGQGDDRGALSRGARSPAAGAAAGPRAGSLFRNIAPDHHYRPTGNGLPPRTRAPGPRTSTTATWWARGPTRRWTRATTSIRPPIRSTSTSPATASSTRRRRRPTTSARVAPAACRRTGGDASHWRSAASISPSCRPSPPERRSTFCGRTSTGIIGFATGSWSVNDLPSWTITSQSAATRSSEGRRSPNRRRSRPIRWPVRSSARRR